MNKYRVYKKWPSMFYTTVKADRTYIHSDGTLNFLEVKTSYNEGQKHEEITAIATFNIASWSVFRKVD